MSIQTSVSVFVMLMFHTVISIAVILVIPLNITQKKGLHNGPINCFDQTLTKSPVSFYLFISNVIVNL